MMQMKKITLSVVAALGLGLAGTGIAGTGYGNSHSGTGMRLSNSGFSSDSGAFYAQPQSPGSSSQDSAAFELGSADSISASEPTESDSSLLIVVAEPNLLFNDGVWYSYADGDWYALDDGNWYSMASADEYAFESSDPSLESSDAYALDGSQLDNSYADASDSSWYYVTEVPYDVVLYTTDGIAWYSTESDELVALVPTEDATPTTRTAMADDAFIYTYYLM
jgi:hypothetical protein